MTNTSWLDDSEPVVATPRTPDADIMRRGAAEGKDRVWWCNGEFVWFRRKKSNPATLERHNAFIAKGDYEYLGTSDDVECYKVRPQSPFSMKKREVVNLDELDFYNVKRLAAQAACQADWETFRDIVAYIRSSINSNVGDNTELRWTQNFADMVFGDQYQHLIQMIAIRHGPNPAAINVALARLAAAKGENKGRIITLGRK